jgi:hypothetical protein
METTGNGARIGLIVSADVRTRLRHSMWAPFGVQPPRYVRTQHDRDPASRPAETHHDRFGGAAGAGLVRLGRTRAVRGYLSSETSCPSTSNAVATGKQL